ncbi:MAG: hypothetical protein HY721_02095 [Planctomycetes bacterium]|nr:hypothetical protein [Planctomycetota bacterium]
MSFPIQEILKEVLTHIERAEIQHMIMGGFAVRSLGVPRPTYDADLTLSVSEDDFAQLLRTLDREGFIVPDEFLGGFRDSLQGMLKVKVQRFEEGHLWDIDLFLVTTSYQRAAFARRQRVRFLGKDRWMIAPEDLVLHKLLANRLKDLLDVDEILKIHRSLDRVYLTEWAGRLGIAERLSAALERARIE